MRPPARARTNPEWLTGVAVPWPVPDSHAGKLQAEVAGAMERNEITVLFQPQFSFADDRLVGAEALARWLHPELGSLGAEVLFAIAGRANCLEPLSHHIARVAMSALPAWPENLQLSINVTSHDLSLPGYVRFMLNLVRELGIAPRRLTLEVTEHALITDMAQATQLLAEFAAQGIRIALDDFGAGYCNFRYLKVLPIHYLKLDRLMLEGIETDKRDVAVLRAMVAMAEALGLQVIAEGIETEAQRAIAAREGCSHYQGFLRAGPITADEFLAIAEGRQAPPETCVPAA